MTDEMQNRFSAPGRCPVPIMNTPASRFQANQTRSQNFVNNFNMHMKKFSANVDEAKFHAVTDAPKQNSSHFFIKMTNFPHDRTIHHNFAPDKIPPNTYTNETIPVSGNHFNFTPGPDPQMKYQRSSEHHLPRQPPVLNISSNTDNHVPFHQDTHPSRQPVPMNIQNNPRQALNFPPPNIPLPVRSPSDVVNYGNLPQQSQYRFPQPLPAIPLLKLPENITFPSNSNKRPNMSMPPPTVFSKPPPTFPVVPPPIQQASKYVQGTVLSDHCNNRPNMCMPPPNVFSKPPQTFPLVPPPTQQVSNHIQSFVLSDIQNPVSSSSVSSEKGDMLYSFLQKLSTQKERNSKTGITVAEFRQALRTSIVLSKRLHSCKDKLTSNMQISQTEWEQEMKSIIQLQNHLSEASGVLTKHNLSIIQKKLKLIKKKRVYKKKHKEEIVIQQIKKENETEMLNQEIDKWLDSIKDKNLKLKREIEMKKEADNILSEVRRKILEAKKTVEKLKVFEKLRLARQTNAERKGLYVSQEHVLHFKEKVNYLRQTMLQQLKVYEAEERALRVMLETEQEGQLEEEALWRLRKMKMLQKKKQKNILDSLFGNAEEPSSDDPLFFFFQHQNSGNASIEKLIQIRYQWDAHLSEEGESIPHQWVVPLPPSNQSWEECL